MKENYKFYQLVISYLHIDVEMEKDGCNSDDVLSDVIKLVNNAFARIFKEAHINTTGGTERDSNKFVHQVLTMMRVLTSKDGGLSSYLDKIKENSFTKTSMKKTLNENRGTQINKEKRLGRSSLEQFSDYVKRLNW